MPKKKKFIDKKRAVTFHLVHRSQHDPLAVDESAPQRVLLPTHFENDRKSTKIKEEEMKYGIYYDDDYNYLQHLKPADKRNVDWVPCIMDKNAQNQKIQLPSSVFASEVEEKIGLLNKAAPETGLRLDLDPDIVAAMDEDFNFSDPDNELEDNFIELAEGFDPNFDDAYELKNSITTYNSDEQGSSSNSLEILDEVGNLKDFDTQSRFTDYSMTSSVITRNSNLTLLDETFEKMYANYDETEIGALECDEIEGDIDSQDQLFKAAVEEFDRQVKEQFSSEYRLHIPSNLSDNDDVSDDDYWFKLKKENKWDCESILSTYSNIYNHPKLIDEPVNKIKINNRSGMPIESGKLTKRGLSQLDDSTGVKCTPSIVSIISELSIRDKNENSEERKKRKHQLKEYRKVRRIEKKANTVAFTKEKVKLEKNFAHNQLNRRGIGL